MAVSLIDVSYSYDGQKKVLDGFSFEFPEKGAVCLMGPSGCGKTTLLRILAGLERPQRGTVEGISGKKPSYVFQENRLLPWLTAVENVAVAAAGENKHSEAESLLKRMGLAGSEHKYPKELSGGMKKRVSIARALAAKGDFLILDEPFSGIDEDAWKRISGLILEEYSDKLIILVTHVLEHSSPFNARIIRLDGPPLRVV